ncbi:MAG TPA: histidine phosphatase family protein [Acidimicrobiales bacterium]|nr:histidine phosphatase family protein [Acidimicrobiales bacterium]
MRHAATEWSKAGRHTGRTDLPLEPDGAAEAIDLGRRLAGLQPALVLSSPLRRALDTSELSGFGEGVETSELLLEMDYGDYEGLTTAQIRELRPGWDLFVDGCPGGETIAQVGARADRLLDRLRAEPGLAGADVLVFSHGHLLRVLTARWLGLEAADARRFALQAGRFGLLGWEYEWCVLAGWNQ